jgi:NADH-quinone oxidoreductase subunit C
VTTIAISGLHVAQRLEAAFPRVVLVSDEGSVTVPAERIVEVALFLRDDQELDCKYLNSLTAVDWMEHFDVVYHLSSLAKNHTLVLKARASHSLPVVPSVSGVWMSANLQEREVYDLMGVAFSDHPGLKRIFLWEGFPGHPLRKDFLALPGGYRPGLQRFPFEFPQGQRHYPSLQDTQSPDAPAVPRLDRPPESAIPIAETPVPAAEVAERARADEAVQEVVNRLPEGAGSDVQQAGGTSLDPGEVPQEEASRRRGPSELEAGA